MLWRLALEVGWVNASAVTAFVVYVIAFDYHLMCGSERDTVRSLAYSLKPTTAVAVRAFLALPLPTLVRACEFDFGHDVVGQVQYRLAHPHAEKLRVRLLNRAALLAYALFAIDTRHG